MMEKSQNNWLVLCLGMLIICAGCTAPNQDEEYVNLVTESMNVFDMQSERVLQPYHGMAVSELTDMRDFAEQAKVAALGMTLSDNAKKSREVYIESLDATIAGTNLLLSGVSSGDTKVDSTAPATNNFIQAQNYLGTAADIMKIPKLRVI